MSASSDTASILNSFEREVTCAWSYLLFWIWMVISKANRIQLFCWRSAHYQLTFRTASREGVLLYAEGPDDYEALFLSNGELLYLLTNPSPSGVEGTSGGFYISNHPVNNNVWVTVSVRFYFDLHWSTSRLSSLGCW